jgi:hypothetical protein
VPPSFCINKVADEVRIRDDAPSFAIHHGIDLWFSLRFMKSRSVQKDHLALIRGIDSKDAISRRLGFLAHPSNLLPEAGI